VSVLVLALVSVLVSVLEYLQKNPTAHQKNLKLPNHLKISH